MITTLKLETTGKITSNNVTYDKGTFQLAGLHADTKPVGTYNNIYINNVSSFVEIDTGTAFLYDETNQTWHELPDNSFINMDGVADIATLSEAKSILGI